MNLSEVPKEKAMCRRTGRCGRDEARFTGHGPSGWSWRHLQESVFGWHAEWVFNNGFLAGASDRNTICRPVKTKSPDCGLSLE